MSNCFTCGTPYKQRNRNHKFCSNACRQKKHREKHGIAEPFPTNNVAVKGIDQPQIKVEPQQRSRIIPKEVSNTSMPYPKLKIPTSEIQKVNYEIMYWKGVYRDAERGVFPASLALGGAGLLVGQNITEKALYAFFGGLVGKGIEEKNRANKLRIQAKATEEIEGLSIQLDSLQKLQDQVTLFETSGYVTRHNDVITPPVFIKADDYRKEDIPSINFMDSEWGYLIGNPSKGFMMVVHGLPGNGKSTMCVSFANYYQKQHGKVLYITREQSGQNKGFQRVLDYCNAKGFDIDRDKKQPSLDYLKEKAKKYDLIVLDSFSHMKLSHEDVEELREDSPNTSILGILQSTKSGDWKGGQEFGHNADVIVKVDNFRAYQEKSRYAQGRSNIAVGEQDDK